MGRTGVRKKRKMIATHRHVKIGELLVARGVLTEEQVQGILLEQRRSARPFGDLAERMFGIAAIDVENAWSDQYLSYDTLIDLNEEPLETASLATVNRRQAWQFRILPLRRESGHLLAATTRQHLRRAVNFAWSTLPVPVCFLIAQDEQLDEHLSRHYPWAGVVGMDARPRGAGTLQP
jgi:hypothetical protein